MHRTENGAVSKNDEVRDYIVAGGRPIGQIGKLPCASEPGCSGREIVFRIALRFKYFGGYSSESVSSCWIEKRCGEHNSADRCITCISNFDRQQWLLAISSPYP